jgi:FKBP-type peptidyl-prolyl cis-trans isomerase FklB
LPTPSYSAGLQVGEGMHRAGITTELDLDAFTRGVKDALAGKASTPEDKERLNQFIAGVRDNIVTRNHAAARDFLAKNGSEKGIVTTASGLQYKIVEPGNAKASSPAATDKVTVQYRGKLLDGTEFDSSYSRGTPATFPVSGVIKGWQEALVLMKPGAKWQLFVPPELAYDANSRPPIPPGSLLVFDVELVSVDAKSN